MGFQTSLVACVLPQSPHASPGVQLRGGNLWGSVLLAGDRLYISNTQGDKFILAASPKYRLIAKNSMGEHLKAALAPSDVQLFIRTYDNLYCVGSRRK